MNTTQAILQRESYTEKGILYMALELSHKTWRLVFSDGGSERQVSIEARNLVRLGEEIGKAKAKFRLPAEARVRSCYEAGRDGFWLHRYLVSRRIENVVLESSSIEVDRRARRAKTDRLDGGKLLKQLMRHHRDGEFLRAVRVPSVEQEDERRPHRELERLKRERTGHRNRLQSLLVTQGVVLKPGRDFLSRLSGVVLLNGAPLPADLKGELKREYERLRLVAEQIRGLEAERLKRLEGSERPELKQVLALARLRGLGPDSAWVLVMEFFGWRGFRNRREVGAAVCSEKIKRDIHLLQLLDRYRHLVEEIMGRLEPRLLEELKHNPLYLQTMGEAPPLSITRIVHEGEEGEPPSKDYDFSRASIETHQREGYRLAAKVLDKEAAQHAEGPQRDRPH